jgi:hypothetical protein
MKRLVLLVLLVASVARAQTPTPATFNPVPGNNASFFSALRTFLLGEDADRYSASGANGRAFADVVFANCTHGTAGGMSGSFSGTCTAFVDGTYVVDAASAINYTTQGATAADFCWVILTKDTTTAHGGWTRVSGTHYMTDCTTAAGTRPTRPSESTFVMGVTISGSAITDVDNLTNHVPWVETYTNASERTSTPMGLWWQQDQTGLISYANGSTVVSIPSGDASGCATCGDSATSFWSTGACENARGCTGQNSSTWTGLVKVGPTPGTWTHEDQVQASEGGFGDDISACEASGGVPYWSAASTVACAFPDFTREFTPQQMSVDGTQCAHATNIALAVNVPSDVVQCADNAAGVIAVSTHLPARYKDGEPFALRLTGVNNGAVAGDTGFNVVCMCAVTEAGGSILTAANFSSPVGLLFTWSGSTSQIQATDVALTCGGSCASNKVVFFKLTVDATATTHASPTQIRYTNLAIEAAGDTLH